MSGDRISLDKLEFDFGFEDVVLVAENFEINGTPYDLNELSELVKLLYDLVWGGGKEAIIESTRCLIDHVVNVSFFIFACKISQILVHKTSSFFF